MTFQIICIKINETYLKNKFVNIINIEMPKYQLTNRIISIIFFSYVVIWYLQIGIRYPALGNIRIEFIIGVLLGVIALITFNNRIGKIDTSGLAPYIFLYFLCILIQIPFSSDIETSWNIFIERILKFSCMMLFIVSFVKSPFDLKLFIAAFLLTSFKMGQEGLFGKITGSMMWENQGVFRLHGSTPMYFHPNSFSGNALGAFPFVYYLYPIVPRWIKALLTLHFIFIINVIIFTGSRTGYLGVICAILFLIISSKNKLKAILIIGMAGVVIISSIQEGYIDRFLSIYTGEEGGQKEDTSRGKRIEILKDALAISLDNPLGVGVGAFPAVRKQRYGRFQDTHNLYLEVLTNLGIQGFLIFLCLIYALVNNLVKLNKDLSRQIAHLSELQSFSSSEKNNYLVTDHIQDLRLIRAVSSAVLMFTILRLVVGLFGSDLYEIYWWFSIGLTVSLININSVSKKKTAILLEAPI